jgi:hypothetical protein
MTQLQEEYCTIIIEFGMNRLIKMWLNHAYSKVYIGKYFV